MIVGKTPNSIVWIIGGFYIPFFTCGLILAATRGFQSPQFLSPASAFITVVGLPTAMALYNDDFELFSSPEYGLILFAIPLSYCGTATLEGLRRATTRKPTRD